MALAVLGGCGSRPLVTVTEIPRGPRLPDGVAVDPEPALPAAVAETSARGVVSLKEPVSDAVLRGAVEAFLVPFKAHDTSGLEGVLSRSVRLLDAHGGGGPSVVREELARRIVAFKAAGVTTIAITAIERFDYAELGLPGGRPRPPEMREGDILVRAHLSMPRLGSDKLLGDVVVLNLRSEPDEAAPGGRRLRVAGFDEQDAR